MANDSRPSRKGVKDDEPSSSKKTPNGGKNGSLSSGESSGLRRSTRETPVKKQQNSSKLKSLNSSPTSSVRKSQRLENSRMPRTPPSSSKKGGNKGSQQSPLRRSERESKFPSLRSRMSLLGKDSSPCKRGSRQQKGGDSPEEPKEKKNEQNLKDIAKVTKRGSEQGKHSPKVGEKRKMRLDARVFKNMFKPLKKQLKVSGSAKKVEMEKENSDEDGDSGLEKVDEERQEHNKGEELEGEELKDDSATNLDGDIGCLDSDGEGQYSGEKYQESEDIECLQVCSTSTNPSFSPLGNEAKDDSDEGMQLDCSGSQKHHDPEMHPFVDSSDSLYNSRETVHCLPAVTHKNAVDVIPLVPHNSRVSFWTPECRNCAKKRWLEYHSPKQEVCCCLLDSVKDMERTIVSKDRGQCETCSTAQFVEKHGQDIQQSKHPIGGEQETCILCKNAGNLLCCAGNGCRRSCHLSCLGASEESKLLSNWYCCMCMRKRLALGVHSVSKGFESIWDVREVEVADSEGAMKQKQCLVKYKDLSHFHNHWVAEKKLLREAPQLLAEFGELKEGTRWKAEWAIPHRLLWKKPLISDDFSCKHNGFDVGVVSNSQCEWLVKWCGLDYDQLTWELEDSPCFMTPEAQRLMREFDGRRDRARKRPLPRENQVHERRKGSNVKIGRLTGGGLHGTDSCFLSMVNKLRDYHHKGHNAILIDEQERVGKVAYLVSSLLASVSRPFLIITADRSLSLWEAEFMCFGLPINVVVFGGSSVARKTIRNLEFYEEGHLMFEVLLSTVEFIIEDMEMLKGIGWEALILDDCQMSCIWAVSGFLKNLAADWRLLLVNSQLKDMSAHYTNMLSLLEPGRVEDSSEDINVLKERLSSFIVCASFLEYWVPIKFSNVQLEQYCSVILSKSIALRASSKSDPVGSLREVLISLRKCCDHPYVLDLAVQGSLTDGVDPREPLYLKLGISASGKLQLLDEILPKLRSQGSKVLILFQQIGGSGRNNLGDILDDFLRLRFGSDSYEHVDGGGGYVFSKKQAALNKFNDEKKRSFFLLETRACFPSIKLSSVDAIIIYNSDWNPHHDLSALQRIKIESKLEQIKVFRLYCSCTVEEKVLSLTKNDMILDSTLQGISPSISHTLLMWGASYLFNRLHAFHSASVSDCRDNIVPEHLFLKDVGEEMLSLVQNNEGTNSGKYISVARQNGGRYFKNIPLVGEQKVQVEDGVPPHVFWTNLLEGKQPQWKYLSDSSQRNRKRAHYIDDSSLPLDVQSDEATKKRKKIDNTRVDFSGQLAGNPEKSNARVKDHSESSGNAMTNNLKSITDINIASQGDGVQPLSPSTLSRAADEKIVQSNGRRKLHNEQQGLFQFLRPAILSLCDILLLKDEGKQLAERFLEYVVNNHRIVREPETMLQASRFQCVGLWLRH